MCNTQEIKLVVQLVIKILIFYFQIGTKQDHILYNF